MDLNIKKLRQNSILPTRMTNGSAGYDLYACLEENVNIKPGKTAKVGTGIAIEILDKNVCGFVFARSGLATNHGIVPVNCVGVIDSDYRGEIIVALKNNSFLDYEVRNEDRIAQLVFLPVIYAQNINIVENLSESHRNCGGFGSTGKN